MENTFLSMELIDTKDLSTMIRWTGLGKYFGKCSFRKERENKASYEGQMKQNVIEGKGTLYYSPRDKQARYSYIGDFVQGKRVGKGKIIWYT